MQISVYTRQRKKCHRYNHPGHAHELTFSCYKRKNLMSNEVCKIFMEKLKEAKHSHDFMIWAYVLMPNHVHLLIWPNRPKYSISEILRDIKVTTSSSYAKYLKEMETH